VRSGAELIRHISNHERTDIIPTTLDALDTLLGGGLQRGKLVELVSRRAAGRFSVVLSALAAATSIGEAAALIDLGDHFDPQLAEANGVDLRRLLWVRPRTVKEAVMSAEMITATGFQMVIVDVGLHPLRGRRAPDAAWVRLARTAEAHGTAMLVSAPYPLTGTACEAVVKGTFSTPRWLGRGQSPRLLQAIDLHLSLEKHRHMRPGATAVQPLLAWEGVDARRQTSVVVPASAQPRSVVESTSRRVAEGASPTEAHQSLPAVNPSKTRRLDDSKTPQATHQPLAASRSTTRRPDDFNTLTRTPRPINTRG
jgi:hypothetical protein